jgi:hypothetical protein
VRIEGAPSPASVAQATRQHFDRSPSHSLTAEDLENTTAKMLVQAHQFLGSKKLEAARESFIKILDLDDLEEIVTADCYLGMAFTYPAGSAEQSGYFEEALDEINAFYAKRALWAIADQEAFYTACRTIYRELLEASVNKNELSLKIKECETQLFALKSPQKKCDEADNCYRNNNYEQARAWYCEILKLIEKKEIPADWMPAHCTLGMALTLPHDAEWRSKALHEVDLFYQQKLYWIKMSDFLQMRPYQLLCSWYYDLLSLIQDRALRQEVSSRLDECQLKLASLLPRPSPASHSAPESERDYSQIPTIIYARTTGSDYKRSGL